jgi:uncharacterized membrane protein YphA (DoxX/SURF4 family)
MNACKIAMNYAPVIGRALLALIFLQSGWDKVSSFQKVVGMGSGPYSLHDDKCGGDAAAKA